MWDPKRLDPKLREPEPLSEATRDSRTRPTMSPALVTCPTCGNTMQLRSSRAGEFWGCRSYPKCKATRSLPPPDIEVERV